MGLRRNLMYLALSSCQLKTPTRVWGWRVVSGMVEICTVRCVCTRYAGLTRRRNHSISLLYRRYIIFSKYESINACFTKPAFTSINVLVDTGAVQSELELSL